MMLFRSPCALFYSSLHSYKSHVILILQIKFNIPGVFQAVFKVMTTIVTWHKERGSLASPAVVSLFTDTLYLYPHCNLVANLLASHIKVPLVGKSLSSWYECLSIAFQERCIPEIHKMSQINY